MVVPHNEFEGQLVQPKFPKENLYVFVSIQLAHVNAVVLNEYPAGQIVDVLLQTDPGTQAMHF